MGGLSIGAFLFNRISAYRASRLSAIYLLWMFTVYLLFLNLKTISGLNYADFIFYTLALICGLLTGSSYPLLSRYLLENKFNPKNIATTIYSLDLLGAFFGTLICGIFLIPFLGIPLSLLILLLLNAIFALKNLSN
jgi:predicted membrane-bound spermidine synthase